MPAMLARHSSNFTRCSSRPTSRRVRHPLPRTLIDTHLAASAYSVRDYGAKGDGTADDTLAIRAAFFAAAASQSYAVYFPPGNYLLTGSLPVYSFGLVYGDSMATTRLLMHRSALDTPVFSNLFTATPAGLYAFTVKTHLTPAQAERLTVNQHHMQGLTLEGNFVMPASGEGGDLDHNTYGIGLQLEWTNSCTFRDLWLYGCYRGISSFHSWQTSLEDIFAADCFIGVSLEEYDNTNQDENNVVIASAVTCEFSYFCGFRLMCFQGSKWVNCEAAGSACYGWYLGDCPLYVGDLAFGTFSNCLGDTCGALPWYVAKGHAANLFMQEFTNCWAGTSNQAGGPPGWSGPPGGAGRFLRGRLPPYSMTSPQSLSGVEVSGMAVSTMSGWKVANVWDAGLYLTGCAAVNVANCNVDRYNKSHYTPPPLAAAALIVGTGLPVAQGLMLVDCSSCSVTGNVLVNSYGASEGLGVASCSGCALAGNVCWPTPACANGVLIDTVSAASTRNDAVGDVTVTGALKTGAGLGFTNSSAGSTDTAFTSMLLAPSSLTTAGKWLLPAQSGTLQVQSSSLHATLSGRTASSAPSLRILRARGTFESTSQQLQTCICLPSLTRAAVYRISVQLSGRLLPPPSQGALHIDLTATSASSAASSSSSSSSSTSVYAPFGQPASQHTLAGVSVAECAAESSAVVELTVSGFEEGWSGLVQVEEL